MIVTVIEVTSTKSGRGGRHYNFCVSQYVSLCNQEATISRGNYNRCSSQQFYTLTWLSLAMRKRFILSLRKMCKDGHQEQQLNKRKTTVVYLGKKIVIFQGDIFISTGSLCLNLTVLKPLSWPRKYNSHRDTTITSNYSLWPWL